MIAVDTSALIAILFREAEMQRFIDLIEDQDRALVGTPTALEFRMVAARQSAGEVAMEAAALLVEPPFELVAFDAAHLEIATRAFRTYGKGVHPAALNFGDCMSYAIADAAGCALLFKGSDFTRTDITPAM